MNAAKIRSRCCRFKISSRSKHSERAVRTNRSATPFAWGAKRRSDDLNPHGSKHLVKYVGELLIPITNQKPYRLCALCQRPRQLSCLLDDPWRARIRRAPGHVHATASQLDEKEDVDSLQLDRFDCEEVDG